MPVAPLPKWGYMFRLDHGRWSVRVRVRMSGRMGWQGLRRGGSVSNMAISRFHSIGFFSCKLVSLVIEFSRHRWTAYTKKLKFSYIWSSSKSSLSDRAVCIAVALRVCSGRRPGCVGWVGVVGALLRHVWARLPAGQAQVHRPHLQQRQASHRLLWQRHSHPGLRV